VALSKWTPAKIKSPAVAFGRQLFAVPVVGMNKPDDNKLMERCIKGDRQAFEKLLIKYEKPVYNAAYRMLHNPDDARDVTQAVFLKVYEHLDQYDPSRRFFSWIYRITLNESINWLKKSSREEALENETADKTSGPEQQAENARISEGLQAALMTIKSDYRSVIVLKHVLGCSYAEISEVLDISEKKVKSRLYNARKLLQERLTDQGLH